MQTSPHKFHVISVETGLGGRPELIHVPEHLRSDIGSEIAAFVSKRMREVTEDRTQEERENLNLCPGCQMAVMFNALVTLAAINEYQSFDHLADHMIAAFQDLKQKVALETIETNLDTCNG